MATTDISSLPNGSVVKDRSEESTWAAVRTALLPLSSLKLTVALFAASLVLILAGTTAQRHYDIWHVVKYYFRTWIAYPDLRDFLPGDLDPIFSFPYPGGWMIGALLTVNLLAAHGLRFKVQAKGNRLLGGLVLTLVGCLVTFAVIRNGLDDTIRSELSAEFCHKLWAALKAALGGGTLVAIYLLTINYPSKDRSASSAMWWLGAAATAILTLGTIWLFMNPDAQLNPSGLRILWQLIQATAASLILWAGCWLLFAKRAGVVLLHAGVGLMMFSELHTGLTAVETHIRMVEGETVSYAEDLRTFELAVVENKPGKQNREIVAPEALLRGDERADAKEKTIQDDALPFDVKVLNYYSNSTLRLAQPGEQVAATAGNGQAYKLSEVNASTGVDTNQAFDIPGVVVELLEKNSGNSLGKYTLYPSLRPSLVSLGEQEYSISFRPKPYDKPYSLKLLDFERETYVGTEKPKSFKSKVLLSDTELGVEREVSIWMNNPLRYRGDTIYQSSFDPNNEAYTDLQAVSNSGWMIPYVACMIVATGMLVHFGGAVLRFIRRRDKEQRAVPTNEILDGSYETGGSESWSSPRMWGPALIVAFFAFYIVGKARPVKTTPLQMQIHEFGQLPVAYGGRVQPIDTLARNTLRAISLSEELKLAETKESFSGRLFGTKKKEPAIKWLLDAISRNEQFKDHRCLRIESLDIISALGLEPRKGFRYSISEVFEKEAGEGKELDRLVREAQEAAREAQEEGKPLEPTQKKLMELGSKVERLMVLIDSFSAPIIDEKVLQQARELMPQIKSPVELVERTLQIYGVTERIARLSGKSTSPPRPIPPAKPDGQWELICVAARDYCINQLLKLPEKENPAFEQFQEILAAYSEDDAPGFNAALKDYQELIAARATAEAEFEAERANSDEVGRKPAERLSLARLKFESYFNHLSPFYYCNVLYVAAFVLAGLALLGWSEGFNRSANWLLWFTFGLHTIALLCRIYISGRPPVTNLYSSAVFIGWAGILFALIFEKLYRMGIGNLLAGIIAFPSLLIAYYLAEDGNDTFEVMQAVLDTQFWLATHVVTITLGYSTTFVAGAFGLIFLVGNLFGRFNAAERKQITRMTYGAICFSILFSFVGTVLGGLWADDSWGRFWGWDPKENGAMMIVIWNAIVLHARWGKMIGERGLAALTVFGNIVVAWSWFGVNLLSVGLHSYGFTENGSLYFSLFALSQLMLMQLAWLPPREDPPVVESAAV
ncbi:cytochrome c biogenesis protein [Adhaeretor mobilis]|uniref:Cytochrome c biogenesis protein CcsA n=1 Tax=Adhaeretor mobilis TaxID=1930276 RepID=A0A517MXQ5_9BACT|nr:cytochrome c biogenesis protein CcsA [Adhaeretor mobilis]QDS99662.1 Cytochrome c biogenesis protein CcsA [Adhaeretor mobilis]